MKSTELNNEPDWEFYAFLAFILIMAAVALTRN